MIYFIFQQVTDDSVLSRKLSAIKGKRTEILKL